VHRQAAAPSALGSDRRLDAYERLINRLLAELDSSLRLTWARMDRRSVTFWSTACGDSARSSPCDEDVVSLRVPGELQRP
jgi:hypothetical protein